MAGVVSQLKTASLGDMLIRRFPPLYLKYRQELRAFEHADLNERKRLQDSLVESVLKAAAALPAYRHLAHRPLTEFPQLTKERLKAAPGAFDGGSNFLTTRSQTSGSSGVPLEVKRSFASVVFEQAAIDHVVALAGGDFIGGRVAILRGEAIKDPSDMTPPYWRMQSGGRVMNFSVAHLNLRNADIFIEALKRFRPEVIWAYPSALEMLAACLEARGERLRVPVILTSSEVLGDDLRALAERLFNARLVDYYGQAERVCFAYALEANRYRFLPAYGQVELQPIEGNSVGRFAISATNLRNRAQPLLRYQTGDIAEINGDTSAGGLEEVALGLRPFTRIEGRESDYLLAPDGSRLVGMNHVPRGIAGLMQMQLRQVAPDRVLVLAVADGAAGPGLQQEITAKVASRLPKTMQVDVEFREEIERQASGKLPLVVRDKGIRCPD